MIARAFQLLIAPSLTGILLRLICHAAAMTALLVAALQQVS